MKLIIDGEGCWPDLAEKAADKIIQLDGEKMLQVAGVPGGMASGLASVTFRFDLPDGTTVLAETSLRLFNAAALGLAAAYPDDE